jgi:hypothetical protein
MQPPSTADGLEIAQVDTISIIDQSATNVQLDRVFVGLHFAQVLLAPRLQQIMARGH